MLVPPLSFLISIILSVVPSSDPQVYNLEAAFNQSLSPTFIKLRNMIDLRVPGPQDRAGTQEVFSRCLMSK